MKFRFFIAAALLLGLAVGCEQQEISTLDEIQVSQSYASLDVNGGSTTIDINATESWQVVESSVPSWLTVSPMSGAAGQSQITFSADATKATNEADIQIVCAGKTQHISLIQFAQKVDPVISSVAAVNAGADGVTYRVKGVVSSYDSGNSNAVLYGNWYITDETGTLYIYGTLDKSGNTKGNPLTSWGIEVGDEVTIEGPKSTYNGTVELVDVAVISITKSLIKVDEVPEEPVALEGGAFNVKLTCKGDGVSVDIPAEAKSWLSVTGIQTSGTTATVTFVAAPNTGGDRSVELTFVTTSAGKTYSSVATIAQAGAIIDCTIAEYLAAEEDDTQYRISGIITTVASDSEKYGANLYIKDATGETYIYGTTDKDGNIQTLASFGAKEGDIIEFVGKRSSYKGVPQMAKGAMQSFKTVTPVKAADVAALADDDKNDPKNYIMLTGIVTKNANYDIAPYGNFDLVDETGSILVYGVSTGWKGETKKFDTLGVKEGDIITIVAYKTSYKGNAQVVGMYVSHESGHPQDDGSDGELSDGSSVFTVDVLPTAYGNESVIKSGDMNFYVNQVANYGSGIQMKKEVSYIANKTACKKISKITLVAFEGKTWHPGNLKVYAGSAEKPETEVAATDKDCLEYDLSAMDCSYFKIANTSGYAVYLDSITVEY